MIWIQKNLICRYFRIKYIVLFRFSVNNFYLRRTWYDGKVMLLLCPQGGYPLSLVPGPFPGGRVPLVPGLRSFLWKGREGYPVRSQDKVTFPLPFPPPPWERTWDQRPGGTPLPLRIRTARRHYYCTFFFEVNLQKIKTFLKDFNNTQGKCSVGPLFKQTIVFVQYRRITALIWTSNDI